MAEDQASKVFVDPYTDKAFDKRLLFAAKVAASPHERALSQAAVDKLKKQTPGAKIRAIRTGDEVAVRVLNDDCRFEKIKFEEKPRHTRFYDDVHAIIGKLKGQKALTHCQDLEAAYILEHNRSTLTITAVAKSEKDNAVITVISGPKEHLYLGVDVPGTRKTLKYDSATKTLQPQGDNPQVYISINYSFGDVVSDENTFKAVSLDRLQLKALFLAGKRPLDSVGLGVGYQLPRIDAVDLSALSIFAGRFWTKQDAVSAQGAPQTNVSTAHDWRVGITYDVAQGLKWIKTN